MVNRIAIVFTGLFGCASAPPARTPPAAPEPYVDQAARRADADRAESERTANRIEEDRAALQARSTSPVAFNGDARSTPAGGNDTGRTDTREPCGPEWKRKMSWINANCQRQRVDVAQEDTSRIVVTEDGRLGNDTFTQSATSIVCPADAPEEMKSFAKAHRMCAEPRPRR